MLVATLFKSYKCDAFEQVPERLNRILVFGLEVFSEGVSCGIS